MTLIPFMMEQTFPLFSRKYGGSKSSKKRPKPTVTPTDCPLLYRDRKKIFLKALTQPECQPTPHELAAAWQAVEDYDNALADSHLRALLDLRFAAHS